MWTWLTSSPTMAPCLVREPGPGARPGAQGRREGCAWCGDVLGGSEAPPLQVYYLEPRPSPLLSFLGCPAKKNVCDSNTCNNGGTCVNQWDAFSCECPLGFGGKSCAQGRGGSQRSQGLGAVDNAGNAGRVGAGTGQGPTTLGCGWKSMSRQSPERGALETKGPVSGRPGHSVGRAQDR